MPLIRDGGSNPQQYGSDTAAAMVSGVSNSSPMNLQPNPFAQIRHDIDLVGGEPFSSSSFHPSQFQVPLPTPFTSGNPHYQPQYGSNQMNHLYPPPSAFSYQSLLNAPVPPIHESQTKNASSRGGSGNKKKSSQATKKDSQGTDTYRRNWTSDEDIALTNAYLYITVDSIVGRDQTSETMWSRILKVWRQNMGDDCDMSRNENSLACHWAIIQASVNKFHAHYESLDRNPQSGTNISDRKRAAMKLYKNMGDGSAFKYEHCWEIMKGNPKWCSEQLTRTNSSKKQKTSEGKASDGKASNSPPTPTTTQVSEEKDFIDVDSPQSENKNTNIGPIARAPGRKSEKAKKNGALEKKSVIEVLSNFQCTLEKQNKLNEQELELKKEKDKKEYELMERLMEKDLELKEKSQKLKEEAARRKERSEKRKEQERILNTDLKSVQPLLRTAIEKRQAQILKEWKEEGLFGDEDV